MSRNVVDKGLRPDNGTKATKKSLRLNCKKENGIKSKATALKAKETAIKGKLSTTSHSSGRDEDPGIYLNAPCRARLIPR